MKPVSEVHFRVIDHGIFFPIARRLARDGAKVSYWSQHEKAFPEFRDCIGDGFDDVERVESPFRDKSSVDCFVFPDVGFGDLQREVISQGFPVWGHHGADVLEVMRGGFLDWLKTTDLPVPPHARITGMSALKDFLKDKEDKYIKYSVHRGDWETMHWRDWTQDEGELDARSLKIGPIKEVRTYFVFDPIDTDIEDGYDGYCVDGKWPSLCIHGMEAKDKAYLGAIQKFSDLPQEVRCVNDAIGPELAKYSYRSFFSHEVRITKEGESYFIDPTCRCGSPPSQVMCELFSNFSDIVWHGANGILIEPEPSARFGVQGLLKLNQNREYPRAVKFPEELDQWVKCGFCYKLDDLTVFHADPQAPGEHDCGWLVATGDTIQEAIDNLHKHEELLPDGVHCECGALVDLLKEVHSAEEKGMEFTEQEVPEPADALG